MKTRNRTALLAVSVVTLEAFAFLLAPAPVYAATLAAGVTVSLPSGFANLSFVSDQTFANFSLPDGHTVCFDTPSTCLSVQKYPAAYPSIALSVSTWQPGVVSGIAAVWSTSGATPSSVWFNFTGLTNAPYGMYVAGAGASARTITGPSASFSWSNWPAGGNFVLQTLPNPGGGPAWASTLPACNSAPAFLFTTKATCYFPAPVPNGTAYAWIVNGNPACVGPSCTFSVQSLQFGNATAAVELKLLDLNGNALYDRTAFVPISTSLATGVGYGIVAFFIVALLVTFVRRPEIPTLHNPEYRDTAIKVSFYPENTLNPQWVSYRQHAPSRYGRFFSKRKGGLWVVYGVRPDGKSEIQAVREPVEQVPKPYLQRALFHAPSPVREDLVKTLYRRGLT